jgi:hypothetical protein
MNQTLSIRDQMAIQILNGLLSSFQVHPMSSDRYPTLVLQAYEITDLMIEQSKKSTQKEIL